MQHAAVGGRTNALSVGNFRIRERETDPPELLSLRAQHELCVEWLHPPQDEPYLIR